MFDIPFEVAIKLSIGLSLLALAFSSYRLFSQIWLRIRKKHRLDIRGISVQGFSGSPILDEKKRVVGILRDIQDLRDTVEGVQTSNMSLGEIMKSLSEVVVKIDSLQQEVDSIKRKAEAKDQGELTDLKLLVERIDSLEERFDWFVGNTRWIIGGMVTISVAVLGIAYAISK